MAGKNPYENNPYNGYGEKESRGEEGKKAVVTANLLEEKKKTAVALEYDPGEQAPKIIEKAQESQVPIHRDERLANTLSKLEIGDFIPPELYEVVAQVLMFVDRLDNIKEKVMGKPV